MSVRGQAANPGECFERLSFPDCLVALHVIQGRRLDHDDPGVHPHPIATRLFDEFAHVGRLGTQRQRTKAAWRLRRSYSRQNTLRMVETDSCSEIDVTDTVAIRHAEGFVATVVAGAR